jgi:23S rRNA pseudouridine1911/1915/1917 synthase
MPIWTETLPTALEGQRLDRVVALVTGVSRSVAADLVTGGAVTVDGAVVTAVAHRVRAEQLVRVDAPEPVDATVEADASVVVPVVFADEHVAVVDKPAGLVVHPGHGQRTGTMVNGLLATLGALPGDRERPGIVHRIDKGTSGLLVIARSEEALDELAEQVAAHSMDRAYLALVVGHPDTGRGVIDAPLARHPSDPLRRAVAPSGKAARTRYEVMERFAAMHEQRAERTVPRTSLVRCELETGRTHQIRVHLAAIGHPVVGDELYGGTALAGLDRPFLHAAELGFDHPVTGERLSFTSPVPPDLSAVLARLRP